jgi:transposase
MATCIGSVQDGASRLTALCLRHIIIYTKNVHQAVAKPTTKIERLRQAGMLNAQAQRVRAAWFHTGGFFDANDLVQVKYEMLRHAQQDGVTKAEAASLFGLSRPTFYQAEAVFERHGVAGLLPRPRGPKSAHKLTPEVMSVIEAHHRSAGPLQAREMARVVHSQLGLTVHPRSIERAMARKKKR